MSTQQSGHIATVGYELYCRLLEQAVRGLKAMPPSEPSPVNVDLPGCIHVHPRLAERRRTQPTGRWPAVRPTNGRRSPGNRLRSRR